MTTPGIVHCFEALCCCARMSTQHLATQHCVRTAVGCHEPQQVSASFHRRSNVPLDGAVDDGLLRRDLAQLQPLPFKAAVRHWRCVPRLLAEGFRDGGRRFCRGVARWRWLRRCWLAASRQNTCTSRDGEGRQIARGMGRTEGSSGNGVVTCGDRARRTVHPGAQHAL